MEQFTSSDQFNSSQGPDPNATVWPPPPTGQPQAALPLAVCPFKWTYRRAPGPVGVKAKISDIREGTLQFDTEGVIIQGKAVPRAEIRALVLIPCFLISLLIAIVANAVMEYGFRRDVFLGVRWGQVREVVLAPGKQQACLIYDAPNYAGKIMTFTLAFTPAPGYYEALAQAVQQNSSVSVAEDRLRSATTPAAWAVMLLLLLFFVGIIIFASYATHTGHP